MGQIKELLLSVTLFNPSTAWLTASPTSEPWLNSQHAPGLEVHAWV